jgi:hypothetical protein
MPTEHPLAALQRPAEERQGPRRVAKRLHAKRQIVHAAERVRMLRAEHPPGERSRSWLSPFRKAVGVGSRTLRRMRLTFVPENGSAYFLQKAIWS